MTKWWIPTLAACLLGAVVLAVPSADVNRALETQLQLASERPGDPAVLNDLGNLLVMAGRPDDAEHAYRTAISLDPGHTTALFNLAILLLDQGHRQEAQETLEKVVEVEPRHAWAHFHLGRILESQSSRERAVREYATAFSLEPELTFPEINPQILDSKLMVQALLKAYGDEAPVTSPRIYADPGHVRELLLPQWAASESSPETPADAGPGEESPGEKPAPAAAAQSPQREESDPGSESPENPVDGRQPPGQASKMLGPDDLSGHGSLGQASPLPEQQGGDYSDRIMRQLRRSATQQPVPSRRIPRTRDDAGTQSSLLSTGRIDVRVLPFPVPRDLLARLDGQS